MKVYHIIIDISIKLKKSTKHNIIIQKTFAITNYLIYILIFVFIHRI